MSKESLFVYGTLLSGHDRHDILGTQDMGIPARCPGRLVDPGPYAALVEAPPDAYVIGEYYEVETELLAELDAMEDATTDPARVRDGSYLRLKLPVTREDGITEGAWVYRYVGPDAPPLASEGAMIPVDSYDYRRRTGVPRREWYFAYGSNLSSRRLRERQVRSGGAVKAVLPHHRLVFQQRVGVDPRETGGVANLVPDALQHVLGVAYRVDLAELTHKLDHFEGVAAGAYRRAWTRVVTDDGDSLAARIYLASPTASPLAPSEDYLAYILEGAREHGLPAAYVERLRRAAR